MPVRMGLSAPARTAGPPSPGQEGPPAGPLCPAPAAPLAAVPAGELLPSATALAGPLCHGPVHPAPSPGPTRGRFPGGPGPRTPGVRQHRQAPLGTARRSHCPRLCGGHGPSARTLLPCRSLGPAGRGRGFRSSRPLRLLPGHDNLAGSSEGGLLPFRRQPVCAAWLGAAPHSVLLARTLPTSSLLSGIASGPLQGLTDRLGRYCFAGVLRFGAS